MHSAFSSLTNFLGDSGAIFSSNYAYPLKLNVVKKLVYVDVLQIRHRVFSAMRYNLRSAKF